MRTGSIWRLRLCKARATRRLAALLAFCSVILRKGRAQATLHSQHSKVGNPREANSRNQVPARFLAPRKSAIGADGVTCLGEYSLQAAKLPCSSFNPRLIDVPLVLADTTHPLPEASVARV